MTWRAASTKGQTVKRSELPGMLPGAPMVVNGAGGIVHAAKDGETARGYRGTDELPDRPLAGPKGRVPGV